METIFNYYLPEELIAQHPLQEREKARLMVLDRGNGAIKEGVFWEIDNYLKAGDTLVLNNSKVIPARLKGIKNTGGKVEIFLLKKIEPYRWEVLLRGNIKQGQEYTITNEADTISARVLEKTDKGSYIAEFDTDDQSDIFRHGETPLPPYIKRASEKGDKTFYQTVYAEKDGSVAAPTAGLHFTNGLLDTIREKGINIVCLTLHIGWASFKILRNEAQSVGEEYMEISEENAHIINRTKREKGRVIAVGTSVVRALESSVKEDIIIPACKHTDLFIKPGVKFRIVDALITNFHLPSSTHLYLVCAFAGTSLMKKAYKTAVEERYRFYSYGDAMLII
ncbi:MAG: tRNA preQ1(34) S-adenosylmethionine ribosyltransferase-isomerase QueA [Elusimicrobia bacterium]|nr:tRNA preQ1(34) S-adenosylmethionine ribosyltransferase-isomerase QueA [Elusimicrobiota bacterium]